MSIYHQILGVEENASIEEMKESYRKLCKKYHPDLSNSDSINKMALINEAYDILVKKTSSREKSTINSNKSDKSDIVLYKDQAYAFYRKGLELYKKVIYTNSIHSFAMFHNNDELEKYEKTVLESLYYFNIVCMQYNESEWYDDSVEKIRAMNRNREFVKNIRNYQK